MSMYKSVIYIQTAEVRWWLRGRGGGGLNVVMPVLAFI